MLNVDDPLIQGQLPLQDDFKFSIQLPEDVTVSISHPRADMVQLLQDHLRTALEAFQKTDPRLLDNIAQQLGIKNRRGNLVDVILDEYSDFIGDGTRLHINAPDGSGLHFPGTAL